MNNLSVKLTGYASKDTMFLVDGQKVKFKNNKFGNRIFEYQTDKDYATITINRFLEINSKLWLFWQLLFFVISIFGIFDMRHAKGYFVVDCELKIKLTQDTQITLKMNDSPKNDFACTVVAEAEVEQIRNRYYVDEKAKKRGKILVFAKILTFIAIAALGVLALFMFIGGNV